MTMMVIRPIRESDQEAFEKFAMAAGTGVTSLPKNSSLLRKKVLRSVASFASQEPPGEGLYIFVLQDIETGDLGGTAAIDAKTLGSEDGYFFRVEELVHPKSKLPMPKHIRILQPIQRRTFASEVGGLYLLPKFRQGGLGKLLSFSRFLFIAGFPERFHTTIISEMRGKIEKNNTSPFWDAVGKNFLNLPFARMLAEVAMDHSIIPKIMPQFPIYISLLPLAAQRAIGKTHKNTKAALNMLLSEGFLPTTEIDIFDGGPKLAAQTSQIRSIANSKTAVIRAISIQPPDGTRAIISNENVDYRATYGTLKEHEEDSSVSIHHDLASILNVRQGDTIRYVVKQ